ncbi:hypothetical protein G5B46_17700 [Caulobacter sp. 602-2]|uniref:Uncharacterized protein n=1 Tax=Caulobacter sp. 602-2 TaxID=2710887 RepID=A0A6G4R2Q2_9CAUL|nr:hypothetical protein [Caulobacter sp. 602-2]NGM51448.1 hypothetical protein [Caulobacter sp. 602-2]
MTSSEETVVVRRPAWVQLALAAAIIAVLAAFAAWSIGSGFDTQGSLTKERRLLMWYATVFVLSPVAAIGIIIASIRLIRRGGALMTVRAGRVQLFDGQPDFALDDVRRIVLGNGYLVFELHDEGARTLHVGFVEAAASKIKALRPDLEVFDPGDPDGAIRRAAG